MKRGAPQGIEIAPASDFRGFRGPNPSPASIFSKNSTFRHHGCMRQGCLSVRSSSCGPRRALILGEDQARPSRSCLILKDFHLRRLREGQKPENIENVPSTQAPFVEQFALSRYYSSVQPLYESHVMICGRAARH